MKIKIHLKALLLATSGLLLATSGLPAAAQTVPLRRAVADLPTCDTAAAGAEVIVTDPADRDDCTVGGGTDVEPHMCICDGEAFSWKVDRRLRHTWEPQWDVLRIGSTGGDLVIEPIDQPNTAVPASDDGRSRGGALCSAAFCSTVDCMEGQGDCADTDARCGNTGEAMFCRQNVGLNHNLGSNTDCSLDDDICLPVWRWCTEDCTAANRCEAGQGDCGGLDGACADGLVCIQHSWTLDLLSYDSVSEVIGSFPQGVEISGDGTKLYLPDAGVGVYNLTTPWDLSTATFDENIIPSPTINYAVRVDSTGTRAYGSDHTSVHQFDLSTAWDLNSASHVASFTPSEILAEDLEDVAVSADGRKLYALSNDVGTLYQYTLASPWLVSSATYDSTFLTLGGSFVLRTMLFRPSGAGLLTYENTGSSFELEEYRLTTPWDLATASGVRTAAVVPTTGAVWGLAARPSGETLYILGANGDGTVYQYTMGETGGWDCPTVTDVCEAPASVCDAGCSGGSPCDAGEGDCAGSDANCSGTNTCTVDAGAYYGCPYTVDICEAP